MDDVDDVDGVDDVGDADDVGGVDHRRSGRDLLAPGPWLLATLGVLALLAATGLWQMWHYRPAYTHPRSAGSTSAQAWDEIYTLQTSRPTGTAAGWVSDAHRGLAVAFVAVGVVLVVAVLRRLWQATRRGGPGDLVALGALGVGVVAAGCAFSSGPDLIWTGVGLWAVTVDVGLDSLWDVAFDDVVRFVVTGEGDQEPREYATDLVGHVLAVPAVLLGAAGLLGLRLRRR